MLRLDSVTKRYGDLVALDAISLDIARGEFFGLLGPNGAGKSTLMSLVSGLAEPDGGTLTFDGVPIGRDARVRSQLGLVPQSIALYADLSAEQNLRIFGRLYGLRGGELRERVEEALVAVRLADRRRDPVRNYSGGMMRRLNLVASLLHRPRLLLCDEPTVGVDPQSRNAIFEYLERLNRDGLTVIYSTHYMEEATRLCSRIGIIDHGRLHALGTLDELLAKVALVDELVFAAGAGLEPFVARVRELGEVVATEGGWRFRPAAGCRLSDVYRLAEDSGLPYRLVTHQRPTLESVFLTLTGSALRE